MMGFAARERGPSVRCVRLCTITPLLFKGSEGEALPLALVKDSIGHDTIWMSEGLTASWASCNQTNSAPEYVCHDVLIYHTKAHSTVRARLGARSEGAGCDR